MDNATRLSTIDRLIRLGVKRPDAFDDIEAAFKSATDSDRHRAEALDQMREAIRAGDVAKAASARGRAVAARNARQDQDIINVAANAKAEAMVQALDVSKAHRQLVKLYDAAVSDFTAALDLCDPDADPAAYLKKRQHKQAEAWSDVPELAKAVRSYAEGIIQLARLAGVIVDVNDLRSVVPLVADGPDHEAIIQAWNPRRTTSGDLIPFGRAGRYGSLIAAGATLTARPLDKVERWSEPAPAPRPRPNPNAGMARAMR